MKPLVLKLKKTKGKPEYINIYSFQLVDRLERATVFTDERKLEKTRRDYERDSGLSFEAVGLRVKESKLSTYKLSV